ncbi:MAG: efflux RND transporter periplasmic adaptor subunit, partial [Bryobacteraceae bacterium]
ELDKAKLDYNISEVRTDVERQLLKLNLDESEARYKQLQADQVAKRAGQAAEIRILELTLLRHTRHRDRHKRDLELFTNHAPMDGLVVMQPIWRGNEMGQVQAGDQVRPGMGFMKVVNTKKMQVEGTINQTESSEFRVGQSARIKLDAFPGLEFNGKLHSIGALATGGWRAGNYIRTVPVRVTIEGNDPRLIPDLSASADVVLERGGSGNLIPLSALHSEEGKLVVYVRKKKLLNGMKCRLE